MVLSQIFARNDLKRPDGRAIYQYEVTRAEYHKLGEVLRERAEQRVAPKWSDSEAAEFCIYIAEWWRRSYSGGAWSYDPALKTLGISDWSTRSAWLHDLVQRGVEFLQRELISLNYTQYLGTLVTEAGLPLNLLEKEGNRLRDAFDAIFRELSDFGAAHRDSAKLGKHGVDLLSKTYQKVETLPQLLGEIALITWRYATLIEEQDDPITALNINHPSWKSDLPLRIDDEQASVFFGQIFGDAQKKRRETPARLKVNRCIVQIDDAWQLRAFIDAERALFATQLAALLNVDKNALPYHLTLRVRGGDETILFASASRQQDRYQLDYTDSRFVGTGHHAAGKLELVAFEGLNEFGISEVPLAEALDTGPWVFSDQEAEEPLQFLGTGSIRTRQDSVLVAVESDGHFLSSSEGAHELVGKLSDFSRDLYWVFGEVRFVEADATQWRIRCAQEEDEFFTFSIRGERHNFEHARGIPIYGNSPSVQGEHRRLSLDELRWKTDRDEVPWHYAPLGDGKVRIYDAENNIIFQRKASRIPDSAKIDLISGSARQKGHLILEDFGDVEIGCPESQIDLDTRMSGTKIVITPTFKEEGNPPANFVIYVRWLESGTQTRLVVPFPAEKARFVAKGQVLPDRGVWNAHALDQIRAEFNQSNTVACDPVVVGHLYADDATQELKEAVEFEAALIPEYRASQPTGRYLLPLARIRSHIDLALAGTMSLGAHVELRLEWSGCSLSEKRIIRLYRYEGSVERTSETSFSITSNHHFPSEACSVELSAFRFQTPDEIYPLVPTTDNEWLASDIHFGAGTWCVVGAQYGYLSHRPLVLSAGSQISGDIWSKTCEIPDRNARRQQFRDLYIEMVDDIEHIGWAKLAATFEAAKELPATTFDALDCLTQVPQATAMALVMAGSHCIERRWNELNELPFAWYLISMSDWEHALLSYRKLIQSKLKSLPISFDAQTHLGPISKYVEGQLGGSSPLFIYLNEKHELGLKIASQDLKTARFNDEIVQQALRGEFQDLLSRRNPEHFRWPKWRPNIRLEEIKLFMTLRLNLSPSWRQPLADAPVLAAIASVTGLRLKRPDVLRIRRLRDFDTRWFDQCYRITQARAIVALEKHPEFKTPSVPTEA